MRKILFRGKRIDNGEWVYGCFIHTGVDAPAIVFCDGEQEVIIPETIGQFTGIEDSEGVKVFEGDTANIRSKLDKSYNAIVEFHRSKFCFYLTDCDKHAYPYRDLYGFVEIEIIGNIHD